MRNERDPRRGNERNYIPNDEIDREEKADLRQQKKGSMFSVLLGGLIVISLIAFVFVLLDSGTGTGKAFDYSLIKGISRPFFLAGGLNPDNVAEAVREFAPFAVDTSSGIETNGKKDITKMSAFLKAVRSAVMLIG